MRLEDFGGDWRFERVIADPDGRETGRVEGLLSFTPGEGGLVAVEQGEMQLAGAAPMRAERRNIWRAEGDMIAVFFGDGRPFHSFDPAQVRPEALHDCPPDIYRVRYDFSAFPLWISHWRVTGPRKDYQMTTRHLRVLASRRQ